MECNRKNNKFLDRPRNDSTSA